ncbi:hypothetical protein LTS17_007319 [Exophiala oligosperma]
MTCILLLPTALLWSWESQTTTHKTDFSTLIGAYLITGTIGMAIAMTAQGILSYLVAFIIFRENAKEYIKEFTMPEDKIKDAAHRAKRREMSSRWSYRFFLVIFCFVMAGVIEEGLKYLALMCASRYGTVTHDRDYLVIPAAAGVGFATIENIAYVYGSYENNESPLKLAITILERTLVGIPGHSMTAALIGVNVLARDVRGIPMSLPQILGVLVLFHGCSDLVLFLAKPALQSNLYKQINFEGIITFNEAEPRSGASIVQKTWDERMNETPILESDADEQLLMHVPFSGSCKLYSILIRTSDSDSAPMTLKLFRNRDDMDFGMASDLAPTQMLTLPKTNDVAEIPLNRALWSGTTSVNLFFEDNHSGGDEDVTRIAYLGFKGDFMALNREPVSVLYEAAANPQDHKLIQGLTNVNRSMPGQ